MKTFLRLLAFLPLNPLLPLNPIKGILFIYRESCQRIELNSLYKGLGVTKISNGHN